ncbi:MAG: glycosyltransferase family 2 protein, partial [Polyangiaceae bacterium]|nr:glycosyltransferase family 2 protein [Polyangiaceae bacterium]
MALSTPSRSTNPVAEKLAFVVPAYNEEVLIADTLRAVPPWVSQIIVVDDASTDSTIEKCLALNDPRLELIEQKENQGVGAAINRGYVQAIRSGATTAVVIAGDNQMDMADLDSLLAPIRNQAADYVKGNRFAHPDVGKMPRLRRWGSRFLSIWTSLGSRKILRDTQCGYTA